MKKIGRLIIDLSNKEPQQFGEYFRDTLKPKISRVLFPCFFFGLLFLVPFLTFSQLNNFQKWSIENGLPQTNVYAVLQDARGYLWIGTEGGLSRFDGIHFKTFTKKDGLSGTIVRAIFQDSKKNLWIGTDEGISFYDGIRFKTIGKKKQALR